MGFKCAFANEVIFPFEKISVCSPMENVKHLLEDMHHVGFRGVTRSCSQKQKWDMAYNVFFLRIVYILNCEQLESSYVISETDFISFMLLLPIYSFI